MVTAYVFTHPGDHITFMVEGAAPATMADGTPLDLSHYEDKTDEVIAALLEIGDVVDLGRYWLTDTPDAEPDMYIRKLRFVGWVCPEERSLPPAADA
jgi:hypothetical protein